MTTSDLVGLRIKTVRRQRGLSQAQLAHPELSDSYVSLIESGKRTPTPAVLELLAQKLDCSLSYLVNGVTAEQMEDIELALGYARLAMENGEISEARTRFAELLANNNLTGLQSLRQDTELGLALASEACGDHVEAIAILNQLRQEDITSERRIEIAIALCRAYRDSERLTEAVQVGEEILGSAARPAWSDLLVELGATLLSAYLERGDLLRARQFAAELLNAADTLGTPRSTVAANWNAAYVASAAGHGDEALTFAERAMAVQAETGQPRNTARMRVALAQLHLRNRPGEAHIAREALRKAVAETSQTSVSTVDRARTMVELARAEIITGDIAEAAEHAADARALLPDSALALGAAANLLLGLAYTATGRLTEARHHVESVRDWLSPMPDTSRSASNWYATAQTMEQLGDEDRAVEAYQRALACAGL
ncbi:helix-turn-helix domain-containing protein [Nonomuraea sp. NPDC050536]|uniref:helix-turn-helix domain-containing protein n=1 Tax=Nonomuraea sp. NPDC050536 TaxID=3364366 RepID=UPI0037C5612C